MGVANNSTVAVMRVLVAIMTRLRSFGGRTCGTHRDRIFKRMTLNAAGTNPSDAVHPRRIPVSLWPLGRHNRSAQGNVCGTQAAPAAGKKADEAGADRTARAPGVVLRFTASGGSHQTLLALVLPEFRRPIRRQGRVSSGRLQISMTEIMG